LKVCLIYYYVIYQEQTFFINSKSTFCTQKDSLDLRPDFEYEYNYTYNYDCIVLKNIKKSRNKSLLKSLETPHDICTLIDPAENLKPKDF